MPLFKNYKLGSCTIWNLYNVVNPSQMYYIFVVYLYLKHWVNTCFYILGKRKKQDFFDLLIKDNCIVFCEYWYFYIFLAAQM